MTHKLPLSKRSVKIKELISNDVGMGTYGLVELELKEFDKEIHKLTEKIYDMQLEAKDEACRREN